MAIESQGAIGSVSWSSEDRQEFAKRSLVWECADCKKKNIDILPGAGKKLHKQDEVQINFDYASKPQNDDQARRTFRSRIDLLIAVIIIAIVIKFFF